MKSVLKLIAGFKFSLLCFLFSLQLVQEVSGNEEELASSLTPESVKRNLRRGKKKFVFPLSSTTSSTGSKKFDLQRKLPPSLWDQVGNDIVGESPPDFCGSSIAMSNDGSRVAVGCTGSDYHTGHVRVYDNIAGSNSWVQVGSDIAGEATHDESGYSLAMSSNGSRVAIGAYRNDSANGVQNSGHVRVYEYIGNSAGGYWVQIGPDIDGEVANGNTGVSVAMSSDGSRVVIGGDSNYVRVYDYIFPSNSWVQVGNDIEGEAADDNFGISVAMSEDGSTVAIGATSNDGNGNDSGHVRLYNHIAIPSNSWNQLGSDIDGEAGDFSGRVAISSNGMRVAIGATQNDFQYTSQSLPGNVKVYDYVKFIGWSQVGNDIVGEAADDSSGLSVAMSSNGSRIVIGAPHNSDNGDRSGHARVYDYIASSNSWVQVGSDIDGDLAYDQFGYSVAMSSNGSRVAIGAATGTVLGTGYGTGYVRVYDDITSGPPFGPVCSVMSNQDDCNDLESCYWQGNECRECTELILWKEACEFFGCTWNGNSCE